MTSPVVRLLIEATAQVGEGPVFDRRTGELCWVDIPGGLLFRNDLTRGTQQRWELATMLGAIAPRSSSPGFAAAIAEGFGFVVDGVLEIVDPVLTRADMRMNDAKCDPGGRLWAGSTSLDFAPGRGSLHRWDGRSPSTVMLDGLTLPNGLGWNAEADVMYLADSQAGTLMSAPFDVQRGEIGDFNTIATIDHGVPDGLAVDLDGCVWLAIWGGSAVHRYDAGGRLIQSIPMPVSQPSSCAFASDGSLVITSARAGLDPSALAREPLAGSVFVVETDTHGVPIAPFAG